MESDRKWLKGNFLIFFFTNLRRFNLLYFKYFKTGGDYSTLIAESNSSGFVKFFVCKSSVKSNFRTFCSICTSLELVQLRSRIRVNALYCTSYLHGYYIIILYIYQKPELYPYKEICKMLHDQSVFLISMECL